MIFTIKDISKKYPGVNKISDVLDESADVKTVYKGYAARWEQTQPTTKKELWRNPIIWACVINLFVHAWVTYSMSNFFPLLLQVELGLPMETAASILGATFLCGFIFTPLGGIVSDRVFKGKRWPVLFIMSAVCLLTSLLIPVVATSSVTWLTIIMILAFGFCNFHLGAFYALTGDLVKPHLTVPFTSLIITFGNIAGAAVGFVMGALVDATQTYMSILIVMAVCCILGIITSVIIRR